MNFVTIGDSVAVCIGASQVSTSLEFIQIRQSVVIRIEQRVSRVVRIQAQGYFGIIRNPIAVSISTGEGNTNHQDILSAFVGSLHERGATAYGSYQAVWRNGRDGGIANCVRRA